MSEIIGITAAAQALLVAEDVLLICHKNPDGDTIGSACALQHALQQKGKRCAILCADPIHQRFLYMQPAIFENNFTPAYVVAVDLAGEQLMGDTAAVYAQRCNLCIDHHPSNTGYANQLLLQGDAAACAQIMLEVIEEMGVELTPLIASCLYTGLATDTACFRFSNTTPATHRTAAKLIELGADYIAINKLFFESKSRQRLELEKMALNSIEFFFGGRCAVLIITEDMVQASGAQQPDLDGITAIPRSIEGVDFGITMRQKAGGAWKVSVRTTQGYSATAVAKNLGGGGHERAAGCELIGERQNAKMAVLAEVEKYIK